MEQLLLNKFNMSEVCRLCLSKDAPAFDIFTFSTELQNQIAGVIMKCAPVRITRCDEMPNLICQSCYTQLEKSHQFQKQIVQSDQTLRRCLKQLRTTNKQIEGECSNQGPSEDSLIHNTNTDITKKSESLDNNVNLKEEVPSNYSSAYAISEKIFIKTEIKEEPIDYESLIATENSDNLIETLSREGCNKTRYEIKEEPIDDNSSIETEGDDTIEMNVKNSEIEEQPDYITHLPPADFANSEDGNKNTSENHAKRKDSSKMIYKCEICNKHFAYLCKLNVHNRIHTGEKLYQCDVCNKCFYWSSHLNAHKRRHTGEKPYVCDACNKSFSNSGNLRKHQRVHTGEKPYRCGVCNKCFSESGVLKKHQRVHTGDKPYQCGVCNKCFRDASTFKKHQLIHTGEKPYHCDVCDKSFNQSSNLKEHQRLHADPQPV